MRSCPPPPPPPPPPRTTPRDTDLLEGADQHPQDDEDVVVWRRGRQRAKHRLQDEGADEAVLTAELVWEEAEHDGAHHHAYIEDDERRLRQEVLFAH